MRHRESKSGGFEKTLDQIGKRLERIRKGETEPRTAQYISTRDHFSVLVRSAEKKPD